ncbi:MAG: hypothetical protein ABIB71_08195 [Candidatus Woesearchaeota archaeon]
MPEGGKMKLKIDKKDCLKKNIKVPQGYRLMEDYECLKEIRTNEELRELLIEDYVWVLTKDDVRAASLSYDSGRFRIDCSDYMGDDGRSCPVFVKKKGAQRSPEGGEDEIPTL